MMLVTHNSPHSHGGHIGLKTRPETQTTSGHLFLASKWIIMFKFEKGEREWGYKSALEPSMSMSSAWRVQFFSFSAERVTSATDHFHKEQM